MIGWCDERQTGGDCRVLLRAPDSAPLKSKMIYASSKDAIKKKFTGECDGSSRGQRSRGHEGAFSHGGKPNRKQFHLSATFRMLVGKLAVLAVCVIMLNAKSYSCLFLVA